MRNFNEKKKNGSRHNDVWWKAKNFANSACFHHSFVLLDSVLIRKNNSLGLKCSPSKRSKTRTKWNHLSHITERNKIQNLAKRQIQGNAQQQNCTFVLRKWDNFKKNDRKKP